MLIVKVPALNGLTKTLGCEKTPDKVIKALDGIWSSEQGKELKLNKIKELPVDNSNLSFTIQAIFSEAARLFKEEKEKLIFLGGDHSISYPLVKAFNSHFENAGLVVLDAHADCMPPTQEPSHEEWLRALIEQGFLAKNVFLVGSRNNDAEENRFLKEQGINLFSMAEFVENLQEACEALMERVRRFNTLYLSIDIDVVDPAFAPGTGYREPGGFSSRQLLYLIQKLAMLKNLKAADIVEVNPKKDIDGMTVRLAAKLSAELA